MELKDTIELMNSTDYKEAALELSIIRQKSAMTSSTKCVVSMRQRS